MDNRKPSFGWKMFRLVPGNAILFYFRKRARLRLVKVDKKRHGDLEGNMTKPHKQIGLGCHHPDFTWIVPNENLDRRRHGFFNVIKRLRFYSAYGGEGIFRVKIPALIGEA